MSFNILSKLRYSSVNIDVTLHYGLMKPYYNSHFEALASLIFSVIIVINGAILRCPDHESRDTIMELVNLYANTKLACNHLEARMFKCFNIHIVNISRIQNYKK